MVTTSISYPSHDGSSAIRALLWEPQDVHDGLRAPRALVQLVHGMSEHVERYADFAAYLCSQGFAVCANDHVGHGKSVSCEEDLGHMPLRGGADILVADVHELRCRVMEGFTAAYPDSHIPYAVFGHSMGSFVTRVYLTRHAFGVDAALICGTGQQPMLMAVAGRTITGLIARARGERYRSKLADSLGAGAYSKAIKDARTPLDWLSTDEAVVDEYIADPRCGQMFSVGAYATLATLVKEAISSKGAQRVPKGLPLLFIAGAEDPVGDCGRGVRAAVKEYRDAGVERVDLKIYEGARHEILNEPIRQDVYADCVFWLGERGL